MVRLFDSAEANMGGYIAMLKVKSGEPLEEIERLCK